MSNVLQFPKKKKFRVITVDYKHKSEFFYEKWKEANADAIAQWELRQTLKRELKSMSLWDRIFNWRY